VSGWFKVFYQGLDNPLFLPYAASDSFENPITFRLDNFADDDSTLHLYSIMIRPCFLPVGMSTSNRIIKPGYESYQSVIAVQQLDHLQHIVHRVVDATFVSQTGTVPASSA
jgi:hypothetical protein